ncbi:hypothetical protein PIB30_040396 [Stylosanthes scabra]|uniref:Reverse transcriptase zinc-binding domain-containing protein n=1 Tax=Stylosanthes scabra TaxID=79078 RepID=A0ABU6QF43_9FABA|nr:hypothetical protein [Stylosanthes scabra]
MGCYSSKSVVDVVTSRKLGLPQKKHIYDKLWGGDIPPRYEMLTWFALNNGLSTKDKLLRRKMIQPWEESCILYGAATETEEKTKEPTSQHQPKPLSKPLSPTHMRTSLRMCVELPNFISPSQPKHPNHPRICVQLYAYAWNPRLHSTPSSPHRACPRIGQFYACTHRPHPLRIPQHPKESSHPITTLLIHYTLSLTLYETPPTTLISLTSAQRFTSNSFFLPISVHTHSLLYSNSFSHLSLSATHNPQNTTHLTDSTFLPALSPRIAATPHPNIPHPRIAALPNPSSHTHA